MGKIDPQKVNKLKKLIAVLDEGSWGREDFVKTLRVVVELIKKFKEEDRKKISDLARVIEEISKKLEANYLSDRERFKQEILGYEENFKKRFSEKEDEITKKLLSVKDGIDADEEVVINAVLGRIKLPEQKKDILDGPEEIRRKLESLDGEDRLDIKYIKGWEDLVQESIRTRVVGGVGPTFNPTKVIQSEVVSGSGTTFTLAYNPINSPAVYALGQRLTPGTQKDYTIAGKVITTSQSWSAGDILADYIKV